MKRLAIAAAVLVLFTGCNKEETYSLKKGSKLTATMGVETKTTLNNLLVSWNRNDQMAIIDEVGKHTFTASADGRRVAITSDDELSETGTYYGFYPASQFTSVSSGTFTGTLLANQTIEGNQKWDPKGPIMIGSCDADAEEIPFVNAHALIEFTFPANATSVTVNTNHIVSGSFNASLVETEEGTTVTVTPISSEHPIHYVALLAEEGGSMSADTPYYLASFPKENDDDVTIFVRYTGTGGNIDRVGLWYYNLYLPPIDNKVKRFIEYKLNRIAQMDLRNATPTWLEPISQVKPVGFYLFIGDDGNAIIEKDTQDAAMKFERFTSDIYSYDTGTTQDQLVTGSALNAKEITFEQNTDRQSADYGKWRIMLHKPIYGGRTDNGDYPLAISTHHSGAFYLYRGEEGVNTWFEGYIFH